MSCKKFLAKNISSIVLRQSRCAYASATGPIPEWVPKDKVTHTGQQWKPDDYRLVRFVNKTKLVNQNFAINLIAEVPPKACKETVVWCDGGSGPEGHPRVYINLDKPGNHACGYCGLRFYKEDHHH